MTTPAVACHWTLSPFVWCGARSYSIYLTHYPLVVFVSSTAAMAGLTSEASVLALVVPASLLLSLPVAWLFNLTVERRFLNTPECRNLSASLTQFNLQSPISRQVTRRGRGVGESERI